jgi:hypothetical protein
MSNYYPETLQTIVAILEGLNAIEKTTAEIKGDALPYIKEVPLTDETGFDYGVARDEVGGAWSWFPAEQRP